MSDYTRTKNEDSITPPPQDSSPRSRIFDGGVCSIGIPRESISNDIEFSKLEGKGMEHPEGCPLSHILCDAWTYGKAPIYVWVLTGEDESGDMFGPLVFDDEPTPEQINDWCHECDGETFHDGPGTDGSNIWAEVKRVTVRQS